MFPFFLNHIRYDFNLQPVAGVSAPLLSSKGLSWEKNLLSVIFNAKKNLCHRADS